MRLITCLFLFLLPACFLTACSSVQVGSDFAPDVDFSRISSYNWKKIQVKDDELASNPLLYNRIVAVTDDYLAQRGYRKVDPGQADVLLVLHGMTREKMRVTDWGPATGYYRNPRYDPWWGPGSYGRRIDVSYYTEGTLFIDIIDRGKQELIWRGVGTSIVPDHPDPSLSEERVREYVREILDQFPPGHEPVGK